MTLPRDTAAPAEAAAPVLRPRSASRQLPARALPGVACLLAVLAVALAGAVLVLLGGTSPSTVAGAAGAALLVPAAFAAAGFVVVEPNSSWVLILFGRYHGTVTEPGLWWVNPLTAFWRRSVSLRVHNFQTDRAKVNDANGSPIEIAAVVVWRVDDTARATFDVEDFGQFVVVQSEAAVRHLASQYPYDVFGDDAAELTLRGNADEVATTLHAELQERLRAAGLEVLEARLIHLAYAPEIAEAMLRQQQASAIVAARRTIVAGAVGLVEMALQQIGEHGIVDLNEERKAAMVSNLMVVLTGDRGASPVINAGSLS